MPADSLIIIGDRVLVRPDEGDGKSPAGLILPASVKEKARVRGGRVAQIGPGHLVPNPEFSESEPWAAERDAGRYIPLQARVGDYALFLRKEAIELEYDGAAYLIVPHGAILALVRPDELPPLDDLIGGLSA